MDKLSIKKAYLHNLKNIDISIPKNKLVAATGVSGSGKSSLAFDIIFEEGRKQYLSSLGIYTGLDESAKYDSISGIGPTIAVQQNIIRQSNPRSTVGSRTSILSLLAILFASDGIMICSNCGSETNSELICKKCNNQEERLSTAFFSYNNPNGMCLTCSGRGSFNQIDIDKLIPDEQITLGNILDSILITPGLKKVFHRHFDQYLNTPFYHTPPDVQSDFIYGHFTGSNGAKRSISLTRIFEGNIRKFGKDLSGIYSYRNCPDCNGYRVGSEALEVSFSGKHIGQLSTMPISDLIHVLDKIGNDKLFDTSKRVLNEILFKLENLIEARLGHLSLYREVSTLSGGELQRLFLTSHLMSKMDSLIYILDEPSSGLHEIEKPQILKSVNRLKDLGNSVIIVEHDKRIIEQADYIIDLGPKAGINGGQLVYSGDYSGLLECKDSLTGQYFSGDKELPLRKRIEIGPTLDFLTLEGASTNNLKNVNVSIPLSVMVGIVGVSGSGKSSLISGTLIPLLKEAFKNRKMIFELEENLDQSMITKVEKLLGYEKLSGFAEVSQQPIGRNSNSNPASYIGIWDSIRKLFSNLPKAKKLGLDAGHFSFNSKGACSACKGSGVDKIWLGGDLFITNECRDCNGSRYNNETLSVKYKGKTIAEILEMSFSEALIFFEEEVSIKSKLEILIRIGMGYIKLGQPTPTLSGGEAQRIKLAKEISRKRSGRILYIFDEPTSGLSMYDKAKLISLLDELVIGGHSVLIIEHDISLISKCDWVIEMGPVGGTNGGYIVAEDTIEQLKQNNKSVTGRYL